MVGLTMVTLLAAAMLLPQLGKLGMYDWDEAIYASVARAVLRSGDPLHLELLGTPYLNKPPLFLYFEAVAFQLFGQTDSAARLTAALFGIANVGLCYGLARRLFGPRVALLSAILLLTHRDFLTVSRHGRMESMVSFFIGLSVLALLNARERKPWMALYALAVSAAVLTKGPMGLLALFVAAPLWLLDGKLRQAVPWSAVLKVLALIAALSLPWFIYQYAHLGDDYIQGYVYRQGLDRLSGQIEGHQEKPAWYYLHIMFFQKVSAWGFLGPLLLAWSAYRWRQHGIGLRLMLVYFGVIVGAASALQTQLPHYTYAAYIPLACLGGVFLTELSGKARYLRHAALLLCLVLIVGYQPSLKARNTDLRALSPAIRAHCPAGQPVVAVGMDPMALHWYADRPVSPVVAWPPDGGASEQAASCWVAPAARMASRPPELQPILQVGQVALARPKP